MIWQNMFAYVANEFVDVTSPEFMDVTSLEVGYASPIHLTIKILEKCMK